MSTTLITAEAAIAARPDVIASYVARSAIPNALLMDMSIQAGTVEGDAPAVRVPYVATDLTATIVAEGAEIPESKIGLSEIVLTTKKAASLASFSREMLAQPNAAEIVADSMNRAVVGQADKDFLNELAKGSAGSAPATVDAFIDAMLAIEAAGGSASHIVASPDVLGTLLKLKTGDKSAVSLLNSDSSASPRRMLLGLEIRTNAALPTGTAYVLDRQAIVSAHGTVELAKSEDAKFSSDSVMVRETFRYGVALADPKRVIALVSAR